jgi:hypothetical protein
MHEISVHTVFEPLTKKHLPFFSCFTKKKIFPLSILLSILPQLLHSNTAGASLCKNVCIEGMSCITAHSFMIRQVFSKEQFPFYSTAFC